MSTGAGRVWKASVSWLQFMHLFKLSEKGNDCTAVLLLPSTQRFVLVLFISWNEPGHDSVFKCSTLNKVQVTPLCNISHSLSVNHDIWNSEHVHSNCKNLRHINCICMMSQNAFWGNSGQSQNKLILEFPELSKFNFSKPLILFPQKYLIYNPEHRNLNCVWKYLLECLHNTGLWWCAASEGHMNQEAQSLLCSFSPTLLSCATHCEEKGKHNSRRKKTRKTHEGFKSWQIKIIRIKVSTF